MNESQDLTDIASEFTLIGIILGLSLSCARNCNLEHKLLGRKRSYLGSGFYFFKFN